MKEKINIAELLKDCPKGMKLYSPIFGDVDLDEVRPHLAVVVRTPDNQKEEFLYDGRFGVNGECMLFPSKENRDWSTFQRPFKDGDILAYNINSTKSTIFIYRYDNPRWNTSYFVALSGYSRGLFTDATGALNSYCSMVRFATEEEKQKLFDAIRENGYKWNAETKTLEKIKTCLNCKTFKDMSQNCPFSPIWNCKDLNKAKSRLRDEANCKFWTEIPETKTLENKKFDINTLKPFDKVLVRGNVGQKWIIDFFGFMDKDKGYPFCMCGYYISQCIPYEGNQHLLGTTDACSDYFKTWE